MGSNLAFSYFSLFFHLRTQMDFVALPDTIYTSRCAIHKKGLHSDDISCSELSEKISALMQNLDCQKPFTKQVSSH